MPFLHFFNIFSFKLSINHYQLTIINSQLFSPYMFIQVSIQFSHNII